MPNPINISASRGAAILGLSGYQTPVQVWLQIMEARQPGFCAAHNYELPVVEDNAAMRWGRAFEAAIIELAENRPSGADICHREKFFATDGNSRSSESYVESDGHFLTCHIDGLYDFNDGRNILHEGKTTSAFNFHDNFGEPGTDQVPVEYQIQCQHQMICTGAEKVILSVLVFPRRPEEWEEMGLIVHHDSPDGMRHIGNFIIGDWARVLDQQGFFHQYHITTHPELQALMLEKYRAFWGNHVLTGTPPEPQTYDDIRALVRDPVGTIIAYENIERLIAERDNIKSEIGGTGPLAKRAEQIKVQVLDWMRGTGAVVDDDSQKKWILRDRAGKKIASYGKNKNGVMGFR